MLDIAELGAVWRAIHQGEPAALADWLRKGKPLSQDSRNAIADLIEGVTRKRGRKTNEAMRSHVMRAALLMTIEQETAALKAKKHRAPRTAAEERVAESYGLTIDQLNHVIHRRTARPRKTTR